jgi:hydroxypyruvate isomerase
VRSDGGLRQSGVRSKKVVPENATVPDIPVKPGLIAQLRRSGWIQTAGPVAVLDRSSQSPYDAGRDAIHHRQGDGMPRFAANLSMMFNEYPFVERFDRAAIAGFRAVEFMFPYQEDIPATRDAIQRNGLTNALFNMPPGDWAGGERGTANDPRRRQEFQDGVQRALEIATMFGTEKLNVLSGLKVSDLSFDEQLGALKENLVYAADQGAEAGVKIVFEPINPFDMYGFMLDRPGAGFEIARELNHPNLKVQYDVYHAQRTEGNLVHTISREFTWIGHVQIADSPHRNEPGTGEINYPYVLAAIDDVGYDGWVGLEYRPANGTERSLRWLRDLGYWPGS